MKISKCTTPTPVKKKSFSYDEIIKREGIYRVAIDFISQVRIIVLTRPFGFTILLCSESEISILNPEVWRKERFVSMDEEELCLEVRKILQ